MSKKRIEFLASLSAYLWILIAIPCLVLALTPHWYFFNYQFQEQTQTLNIQAQKNQTYNLILFFTYQETLNSKWSATENIHMHDVRTLYLILGLGILISILILCLCLHKEFNNTITKLTFLVILALVPVLVVFSWFWNKIFHTLLFSNQYWVMTPLDLSFYLFPQQFFLNSGIFIIIFMTLINSVIYVKTRT